MAPRAAVDSFTVADEKLAAHLQDALDDANHRISELSRRGPGTPEERRILRARAERDKLVALKSIARAQPGFRPAEITSAIDYYEQQVADNERRGGLSP